jgi:L-ascorbate metabolism protein UlaG (beta-lactamase superfamily)
LNIADIFLFVIASPRLWEGVAISVFHEALKLLRRFAPRNDGLKYSLRRDLMAKLLLLLASLFALMAVQVQAKDAFQSDVVKTSAGDLKITFIGHGTLLFTFSDKVIHVDPWSKLADYSTLPKADLILITHEHQDHFDMNAIKKIKTNKTKIIANRNSAQKIGKGAVQVMANGDTVEAAGLKIEAVPAYNLVHMRSPGQPYHPKGDGNGYIITFGDKRVYVAGDTENTPEMKALRGIDIAFLPMNLPYTMTPEMVADAAKAFKPKVLYPYHTGDTDLSKLTELMKGTEDVEVRLRNMK